MSRRISALLLVTLVVGSLVGAVAMPSTAQTAQETETEPNDEAASATTLPLDTATSGAVAGSDTDWFAVTVERSQTVTVSLDTPGTVDISFYDADQRLVDSARTSGESVTLGSTTTQNGTVFVQVRAVGGGGEYTVTASTVAGDAFEPNEEAATASPLPNETITASLARGDTDWYSFEATRGQFISAQFSRLSDGGSVDVFLFDPDGRSLDSARVGSRGQAILAATAPKNGTYRVQVREADGTGAYQLGVSTRTTDGFEPNEEQATALDLDRGGRVSGELTEGDTDWFALRVENGDLVRTTLTRKSDGGSFDLLLIAPDGRLVDSERVGSRGRTTLSADVGMTGTYFVQLRPIGGTGGYDLDVRTFVRALEPSDNPDQATPLENRRAAVAALTAGDTDWFAFRGGAGQALSVDVDRFNGEGEAVAVLTGVNGSVLDSVRLQSGDRGQLGATAPETGVYRVAVRSDDLLPGEGEYTIGVESAPTDPFEPNESPANAAQITPDEPKVGALTVNDRDWFAVEAVVGERLDVALENVTAAQSDGTAGGQFVLTVRGPAGGVVATDTVRDGETAQLSAVAEQEGTYTVGIASERGELDLTASVGNYELTVETVLPDANEPNDDRANATSLGVNDTAEGVIAPEDVDWFASTVDRNGTLGVTFDRATPSGVSAVAVYGPDGIVDLRYVGSDVPAELEIPVESGEYAVQVVDVNGGTGPYTLELGFTPASSGLGPLSALDSQFHGLVRAERNRR